MNFLLNLNSQTKDKESRLTPLTTSYSIVKMKSNLREGVGSQLLTSNQRQRKSFSLFHSKYSEQKIGNEPAISATLKSRRKSLVLNMLGSLTSYKEKFFKSVTIIQTSKSVKNSQNESIGFKEKTLVDELIEELKLDSRLDGLTKKRKSISKEDAEFLRNVAYTDKDDIFQRRCKCMQTLKKGKRDGKKILNLLKTIPEFLKYMKLNSITDDAILKISEYMTFIHVKSGNYVFNEGDNPDGFYCVISGTVEITKRTSVSGTRLPSLSLSNRYSLPEFIRPKKKKERLDFLNCFKEIYIRSSIQQFLELEEKVLSIGKGGCFGEWSLIDNQKRYGSAIAKSDCQLIMVPKNAFDLYIKVRCYLMLFRNF